MTQYITTVERDDDNKLVVSIGTLTFTSKNELWTYLQSISRDPIAPKLSTHEAERRRQANIQRRIDAGELKVTRIETRATAPTRSRPAPDDLGLDDLGL